ncbi:MAG: hypothetical protein AAFQ62_08130 [Pseudomonadota bacterium]
MKTSHSIAATLACLFAISSGWAQEAQGQRSDFELTAALGRSDNLGRSDSNEVIANYVDIGTVIDWARTGKRYQFAVSSDLSFREFDEDTFDGQLFGDLDAILNLSLVPEMLSWTVQNRLGQGRINELQPAAPDNRQDINDFTTGPRLALPIGRVGQLSAEATYSTRTFDNSGANADSDATVVRLDYTRALNASRNIGLAAVQRQIEFDDLLSTEFDINSYFLTINSATPDGSLSVELGLDRIDRIVDKDQGLRARLTWVRAVGAYSSLSLSAGRRLTDNGSLLGQSANGDVFDRTNQIAAINDALRRTDFIATFEINRPRSKFDVSLGWIDDEFETLSINDAERYTLRSSLRRDVSPRANIVVDGQFLRRDFSGADERNDEWQVSIGYNVEVGRRSNVGVQYVRRSQHSTDRIDFEENLFMVMFSWALSTTDTSAP